MNSTIPDKSRNATNEARALAVRQALAGASREPQPTQPLTDIGHKDTRLGVLLVAVPVVCALVAVGYALLPSIGSIGRAMGLK